MDHYGGASDWVGLREPHRKFHYRLYAAGGDRLVGLITELAEHAERYRVANAASLDLWERRQREHRAIAEAAAERDPESTTRLLVEHYARTAAMICADLDAAADLTRLAETLERAAPGSQIPLVARA